MMSTDDNQRSLLVLYKPNDLQWVTKICGDLREKYDYTREIILVPLSSDLSQRTFVLANHFVLHTKDIFDNLLNISEITAIKYNPKNHLPKYPDHSVLLVECLNSSKEIKRVIWASNKYFDDIGTFASKRMRHEQLLKAIAKLND